MNKTHIDTFTCGTVSHSAPELFRRGLLTPAADVYSFGKITPPLDPEMNPVLGILLWELISGTKAFNGVPHNSIIMAVTSGCRPLMPSYCPQSLSNLINDCWQDSYSDRPTFKLISTRLREMIRDKNSFLSSESEPQTTSISLSATTSRDSRNQTNLPDNEVSPDKSETRIIEDSTKMVRTRKMRTLRCVVFRLRVIMGEYVQGGGSPLLGIQLTGVWVRKARKSLLKLVELKKDTGTQLQV